jgi:arginase
MIERSTTGEAANMEIALLLGLSGQHAPLAIRQRVSMLGFDAIAMFGQRDEHYRREIGVPSVGDRVRIRDVDDVRRDPEGLSAWAATHLAATRPAGGFTSISTHSTATSSTLAAPLRTSPCRGD